MTVEQKLLQYREFEESIKSQVNIKDLYTELTGFEFVDVKARLRAKVYWRHDEHESLTWVPDKNILTDFTEETSSGKGGNYNPIDIMIRCAGATNRRHALQLLCDRLKIEIPSELRFQKDEYGIPASIGKALKILFEQCIERRRWLINNPSKIPASLLEFLNKRNIPIDNDFFDSLNIGICPNYDVFKGIWIENKIPFIPDEKIKDKICISKQLTDNGLVFPLHNEYGGLCGLKFRYCDEKRFTEWRPVTKSCFYNLQRFPKRPKGKTLLIVEGEMNLVAYGISAWKYHKAKDKENLVEEMNKSLNIIYSTGSKSSNIEIFKDELPKVLYFPDYDISEDVTLISNHPIVNTCSGIAKQINAIEIDIIDWSLVQGVHEKYDLEDFLKSNNYDISRIQGLERVSLPRYCFNVIYNYCEKIDNLEKKRIAQINLATKMAEKLSIATKVVFQEIVAKEFSLNSNTMEEIDIISSNAVFGNYKIEDNKIVKIVELEDGKNIKIPMTNFYCKLKNETMVYDEYSYTNSKIYTIEVVVGNDIRSGLATPSELTETTKFMTLVNTIHSADKIKFLEPEFIGKKEVILGLMKEVNVPTRKFIFTAVGRPHEDTVTKLLKTSIFCIYPKVSVINGKIESNKNVDVQLSGFEENEESINRNGSKYQFSLISEKDYKEAANLFWYDLRKLHDQNLMQSLMALCFDSCTRELHGSGIVPDHGFTIYLEGQSDTNKTTATVCAMSLLGDFKDQNDLLNFNTTVNNVEMQLIGAGTAVAGIDELKAEHVKQADVVNILNGVYGGNTRGRLGQHKGVLKSKGSVGLQCSIIITSEGQPNSLPESIASRMLIIRVPRTSNEVKQERKKHLDIWRDKSELLKGFMPYLIAWAQKEGSAQYIESLLKWKKELKLLVDNIPNHERVVDMVCRLVSGFELICEFLVENQIVPSEEAQDAFHAFVLYWKNEIKDQLKRVKSHSSSNQNIVLISQLIHSGAIIPRVYSDARWLPHPNNYKTTPIMDVTYPDAVKELKGQRKLLIVAENELMGVFEKITGVRGIMAKLENDLKESGLVEMNEDRSTKKLPCPHIGTNRIDNKSMLCIAIDYEKFIKAAREATE